jgi:hypothetical protein
MKRPLRKSPAAAALIALALLSTGACDSSQSGGSSNPDNQIDEAPGQDAEEPEDIEPS